MLWRAPMRTGTRKKRRPTADWRKITTTRGGIKGTHKKVPHFFRNRGAARKRPCSNFLSSSPCASSATEINGIFSLSFYGNAMGLSIFFQQACPPRAVSLPSAK
nr:hypothetical protein [Pandoravirus massiliensis]